MIIKKWSGSAWVDQYPKTTGQQVFTSNGSTALFDSNNKLIASYLPDSVIGGMNFAGTVDLSTDKDGDDLFALSAASGKMVQAGDYLIVTAGGNIASGASTFTLAVQAPGDEGDSSLPVTLEAGDWLVLTEIDTSTDPDTYTVAILNNTYRSASTSSAGIVELATNSEAAGSSTSLAVTPAGLGSVLSSYSQTSHTHTLANGATDVTASAAELNVLDGITSSTAELNKLDGYTGSVTELNYLDSLHATGVTSTEFDYLDGVTSNIQTQLNSKQGTITGAASTITGSNLTASRVVVSNSSGKVAVSNITSAELDLLDGLTSNVQTQIDSKQATITGAATTIDDTDLTASRALVSSGSGKVAVSAVTSTELGYLDGVTSAIQTQLNSKQGTLSFGNALSLSGSTLNVGAGEGITVDANDVIMTYPLYVQTATPSTSRSNAIWLDIN